MSRAVLPPDHSERMERVLLALDGLSVGDALGGQFFNPHAYEIFFEARRTPGGPWGYTDDTEMALGISEVLGRNGQTDQDELALVFARRYEREPFRGYGAGAHQILSAITQRTPWREAARELFGGMGSLGNGAAMRVAPVGAYFADDDRRAASEAAASAEVTHAHPEGIAGAVAVAVAAAWAWTEGREGSGRPGRLFEAVLAHVHEGKTRQGILRAQNVPLDADVEYAAYELGNGSKVTAPDTVPLTLWCAARHLNEYPEAIWTTIGGGGDIDTTCAIVGGIVALAAGRASLPVAWLEERESLDYEGTRPTDIRRRGW